MNPSYSNEYVLEQLKRAMAVMEVQQANIFRIRAYQNATASIRGLDEELHSIIKRDGLDKIPGVGKELSQKIKDVVMRGKTPEWETLFTKVPAGMFGLLDIPGIGPKRAFQLATAFRLTNPDQAISVVKTKAEAGEISKLPGFANKLEQEILSNLNREKPKTTRLRLDEGEVIAAKVTAILKQIPEVKQVSVLGSLRRREETVGDVDIAVATTDPKIVSQKLAVLGGEVSRVEAAGNNMVRLVLTGNKQADIKFQTPDKFGATLQHFTGSKFHNIALREYALTQNKSLSEHGIKFQGKLHSFTDETSFYHFLDLPYIPPEIRQNSGELEAARAHMLPNLVKLSQIKGDFHTHTDFSWRSSHDYGDRIPLLLDTAISLGYEWIGLGDHNPSQASYTSREITQQICNRNQYIDDQYERWQNVNNRQLHILRTLEVDILPSGELPLPDEALELLDFVIISFHSRLHLDSETQTKRLLSAINHPKVKIWGHPTGRLINQRSGMTLDWDRIFEAFSKRHIALEINAQPARLDVPDTIARQAIRHHLSLTLGSDAHVHQDLKLMPYAVDVARRAWATKSDIINTLSFSDLYKWINT